MFRAALATALSRTVPRRAIQSRAITARSALPRPHAQAFVRRHNSTAAGENLNKSAQCPSCSAPLPSILPACPQCLYIAPLSPELSYHYIMGISTEPNPFLVNERAVTSRYWELMNIIHPDKWSGQSPSKQDLARTISSKLNTVRGVLNNPLKRIEYLLKCQGYETVESDSLDDPELIMEVMDSRESVERAESHEEIEEIRAENDAKLRQTIQDITDLVAANDWPAVRDAAIRLRYLQGIENAAKAWPHHVSDH